MNIPVFPFAWDTAHRRHSTNCLLECKERKFHHAGETRGRAEPSSGSCRAKWGGGKGDGDPRSLGEGTGHQGISVEVVRRALVSRADPVIERGEMRCSGVLRRIFAPCWQKRRKELANASHQRCWIPVTRVCISHSFKYLLIFDAHGLPSRALAGSSDGRARALSFGALRGHTAWLLLQSTRAGCRRAGFSGCSARTELPRAGIRDLPEPGIDLLSSALAEGRILSHWTTRTGQPITFAVWKLLRPGCWRDRLLEPPFILASNTPWKRACALPVWIHSAARRPRTLFFSGLCKSCCCGRFVSSGSLALPGPGQFPHLVSPRVYRHAAEPSRWYWWHQSGQPVPAGHRSPLAVLLRAVRRLLTEAPAGHSSLCWACRRHGRPRADQGPGRAFGGQSALFSGQWYLTDLPREALVWLLRRPGRGRRWIRAWPARRPSCSGPLSICVCLLLFCCAWLQI